jgi:hypothetical protein
MTAKDAVWITPTAFAVPITLVPINRPESGLVSVLCATPPMIKLYKRDSQSTRYWEAWKLTAKSS